MDIQTLQAKRMTVRASTLGAMLKSCSPRLLCDSAYRDPLWWAPPGSRAEDRPTVVPARCGWAFCPVSGRQPDRAHGLLGACEPGLLVPGLRTHAEDRLALIPLSVGCHYAA